MTDHQLFNSCADLAVTIVTLYQPITKRLFVYEIQTIIHRSMAKVYLFSITILTKNDILRHSHIGNIWIPNFMVLITQGIGVINFELIFGIKYF